MNRFAPAIVVLNQTSVSLARQISTALPNATIYGLIDRTSEVEISFTNFGETLRDLFAQGTPIIGICAAGILIRTLAPLLTDKWHEPPVLAVAEDGSAVVPLLGGLHGVNDLARQIAAALHVAPAVTTTGDIRFRTALLSPPAGYRLANPEAAKTFIADLLAGKTVRLIGDAAWLKASKLPITEQGDLTIQITERTVTAAKDCLVYHPCTVAIAVDPTQIAAGAAIQIVEQALAEAELAVAAVAGIFALSCHAANPVIQAIAQHLKAPVRLFKQAEIESQPAALALAAIHHSGSLCPTSGSPDLAIAIADQPVNADEIGDAPGYLAIIGTGPGGEQWMSPEVKAVLQAASDWVGYKTYLDLVEPLRRQQQRHESDNREELDRAKAALDLAASGRSVAVVSSGDPGIYAMAAAVFEALEQAKPEWQQIQIQVCPGISAMQAAAAQVGAPLGHDFCAISLSDILKPWEVIEQRIAAAAQADFVIAFYNPVSKQRLWQLEQAKAILLLWRSPETPVVLARNLGRPGQTVTVKLLHQLISSDADMRTVILIGSSKTRILQHGGRDWVYTPRRY